MFVLIILVCLGVNVVMVLVFFYVWSLLMFVVGVFCVFFLCEVEVGVCVGFFVNVGVVRFYKYIMFKYVVCIFWRCDRCGWCSNNFIDIIFYKLIVFDWVEICVVKFM